MIYKFIFKNNEIKFVLIRRLILILLDLFLINFSIILSFFITGNNFKINNENYFFFFFLVFAISPIIYILTNQYKGITKYIGSRLVYQLYARNLLIIIC